MARYVGWSCGLLLMISVGLTLAPGQEKPEEKFKLTKEEQTILELTNKAREKEKLPPLKLSSLLSRVARAHSANMAKQEDLNHELDGKKPGDRIKAGGYEAGWTGENIAMTTGHMPAHVFQGWMESEPHKENILRSQFEEIGIGMAKNDKGEIYYTQVFASPAKKR